MTPKSPIPLIILKALGPGERWITVKPHGPDAKGTPVLIRENPDGSASVIGGAGGHLNYLRLHGVKSESEYKQQLSERQKAKREQRADQRKRDKEAGVYESKQKAKESIKLQRREHEQRFIRQIAEAMGWDEKDMELPEESLEGLSDAARKKAVGKHHGELMKRAKDAVDLQRRRLLADAEARAEADIGTVPLLAADPEQISVEDLDPVQQPSSAGIGYATDYKNRAVESGLTEDELQQEAQQIREQKLASMTDGQRRAAINRGETAKLVRQELEGLRTPEPPPAKIADVKKAVELLKAEKQLKAIQKRARELSQEADQAKAPKAYILEVGGDGASDSEIMEDLNNDLRTVKTRAFLSELGRTVDNPHEALGRHVGVGAYNAINSLSLAVGGDSMIDRSAVDVLGIAGAAQVLARRLHNDLDPDEMKTVAQGMEDYHLHHYMQATDDALREAREYQDFAKEIEVGEAASGADLMQAQEMNAKRRDAINHAERILGTTLGEMEANAAMVMALKQGAKDSVQVPLGNISPEAAIQQARAIGLQRGDYTIDRAGADHVLTINGTGMDRLAKGVDRESVKQIDRNLSIIRGDHDEDNWLPLGFANRPDLDLKPDPGVAQRLAVPFEPGEDLEQSVRDYIGGRAADGDSAKDILADLQSSDFVSKVGPGRSAEYLQVLNSVAPLKGEDGKGLPIEKLTPAFQQMADDFVARRHGGQIAPIHRQQFDISQTSVDALHRALAEEPSGVAAFKSVGDLSHDDQRAIRDYFARNVAKESPDAGKMRSELEQLEASEPEKQVTDMFGESATNPEWEEWRQRRDELSEKYRASTLTWSDYVKSMRGTAAAYESVQDLIRSKVNERFAHHHNTLNPGSPLKVGRTVIRNNLAHLDTVDPEARRARMEKERALVDSLRERVQGRYASGDVADKLNRAREDRAAAEQSQMGFFSTEDAPVSEERPLGADERHTIGHQAERQIASMMSVVGKNFKPGQPLKLWQPTMSGKGVARQRAIKYLDANKRMVLAFGVGSGKTAIMLGGLSHLHQQGKIKRGLFLVPSIVQGQFSGEALRYLEPGKFNWHIQPGAGREERIKAYKNPEHHFAVMTHQSFRDDMVHLGAKHAGIPEDEMADRLGKMSEGDRKDWIKGVMEREGINFDYLAVDEGHNMLNRAGKENSTMANVVDALSAHTPYYVSASGDPVKNDTSEMHDLLKKMEPERYGDRAAFMRRYGVDTDASREAMRREMARYVFPSRIDPETEAERKTVDVKLSDGQRQAMDELDKHLSNARIARIEGRVDADAMKAISPSTFEGVPEDQHEALAKDLQANLGILRSTAVHRILNEHPESAKFDELVKAARERHGKPGVVFARSLDAVRQISDRLGKEGFRVATITGADSAKEKDRKRQLFNPDGDQAPEADILVASDAGATGMNIQRGQWLWQHDTPDTAMTHAQRQGRIYRTGQKNNVELLDAVADHPDERRARDRLSKKYGLRELMTSPLENLDDTGLAYFLKRRQVEQQSGQSGLF